MNLITGGTGIVGARLAFDLLKKERPVRCTKRKTSDTDFVKKVFEFYDTVQGNALFKQIEWVESDLLDTYQIERALEGIEHVFHTAALISYQKKDRKTLYDTNVTGTANVVNFCIDSHVKSFCHVSSVAALGVQNEDGYTDESSKWNRNRIKSHYALSKYLAEREVWRGSGEGLDVVIVNPSIILGPAKPHQSSGSLMHLLKKGVPYYPAGTTGFIDVRDVSRLSLQLVDEGVFQERFILNSENLAYQGLLNLSAKIFRNKHPKIKVGSMGLEMARIANFIQCKLTGSDVKITSETAKSVTRTSKFSNEKIKKLLGAEFIPVENALKYYAPFLTERL